MSSDMEIVFVFVSSILTLKSRYHNWLLVWFPYYTDLQETFYYSSIGQTYDNFLVLLIYWHQYTGSANPPVIPFIVM